MRVAQQPDTLTAAQDAFRKPCRLCACVRVCIMQRVRDTDGLRAVHGNDLRSM